MKKVEALQIAPKKSRLLCEYIIQILSDNKTVNGEIRIDSFKTNNERMLTFDITAPSKGFEKHLNTGITTEQVNVLTEQIFNDLIDNFTESETMACSRYYSIKSGYGMSMNGVSVINSIGSRVDINFIRRGDKFNEQVENYNLRLNEYVKQQENGKKLK